jgi:hypothetical protein
MLSRADRLLPVGEVAQFLAHGVAVAQQTGEVVVADGLGQEGQQVGRDAVEVVETAQEVDVRLDGTLGTGRQGVVDRLHDDLVVDLAQEDPRGHRGQERHQVFDILAEHEGQVEDIVDFDTGVLRRVRRHQDGELVVADGELGAAVEGRDVVAVETVGADLVARVAHLPNGGAVQVVGDLFDVDRKSVV